MRLSEFSQRKEGDSLLTQNYALGSVGGPVKGLDGVQREPFYLYPVKDNRM